MKDPRPKYRVSLYPQNFGDNGYKVFLALKEAAPELKWSFEIFEKTLQRENPIYFWSHLTREEYEEIKRIFNPLEVQLSIETVQSTFLFPTSNFDGYHNSWFSSALLSLEEDALDEWAKEQQVSEVYRFTEIPSFTPPISIRVWQRQIVRKDGTWLFGKDRTPPQTIVGSLKETDWTELTSLLNKHLFWTSDSWYTVTDGWLINDGEVLLVEGYNNGQYKALYDHSPKSGAALNTSRFLFGLQPKNK